MKISALGCDADGCNQVIREEGAKAAGWLTVGGERRGRARVDLCGYHARKVVSTLAQNLGKKPKRTP